MRNHLRRWRRAGGEKQSQPERAGVERGYLPENETESTFLVSSLRSLRLKCCGSEEREERKRIDNDQRWGGCQQFAYMVISQKRLQHEKYTISVLFLHDRGGDIFFFFFRLSDTLNCWISPMNMSQTHFKELTNSISPRTFDKNIFGCL